MSTADFQDAGTDSLVQASILRDGSEVILLNLDYPTEDDLERGTTRAYDYPRVTRSNDRTRELPPGIGQDPMPYPSYGIEFSDGPRGHLGIRLRIRNDDMWIKSEVDLYVREVRRVATSFDTLGWVEDPAWTFLGKWNRIKSMSTDGREGDATWTLGFP